MVIDALPPTIPAAPESPGVCEAAASCLQLAQRPAAGAVPEAVSESAPRFSSKAQDPPPLAGLLRLGSRGEPVRQLQQQLRSQTFDPGPIDGVFGPKTQAALRQFQSQNDLQPDGIVGPLTWGALWRAAAHSSPSAAPATAPKAAPDAGTLPAFSPTPALPSFTPMDRTPAAPSSQLVWLAVLMLIATGGSAYRLRRTDQVPVIEPDDIYHPTPVYPQPKLPPVAEPKPGRAIDALTQELKAMGYPRPWASAIADHLDHFLFDLLDPASRHELASQVHLLQEDTQKLLIRMMAFLPIPIHQIGIFPPRDPRTGEPFHYELLDDLGGCFMIKGSELWMTRAAERWLEEETPYVLTIRRRDSSGAVLDEQYTIRFNQPESAPAAAPA